MNLEDYPGPLKAALGKDASKLPPPPETEGSQHDDEDIDIEDIQYDLRLLEKNIGILLKQLSWSARILINIFPYYPKWVFNLGKPWFGIDHTEGFLFFYAFALTLHFVTLVFGFFLRFIVENPFYNYDWVQVGVEWFMFVLTFQLFFYYRCKSYLGVYFWVLFKVFYWSSIMYSALVPMREYWKWIEVIIHVALDIYITIAMLMHSLIDYSRHTFTHAVLSEILEEELRVANKLIQDEDEREDWD